MVYSTDSVVEQNTLYANIATSLGGGIYGASSSATFRNNIVWANTANGLPNQIDLPAVVAVTYCDVEGGYTGAGNIAADPKFVETSLVQDRFFDDFAVPGTFGQRWFDWGGSWRDTYGYMQKTNSAGGGSRARVNTDPDFELWFSYRRAGNSPAEGVGVVYLRYMFSADTLFLVITPTNAFIVDRVWVVDPVTGESSWDHINLDWNNDADTANNTWYDYYVRCIGQDVEVWRSEGGRPYELILATDENDVVRVVTTEYLPLSMQEGQTGGYDDILLRAHNNLGEFLHLNEFSPCIDMGDTPFYDHDNNPATADVLLPFRDFDDMKGPLDADGLDTVDNDGVRIERDIGADEWPQPEASSFWWKNF